MIINTRPCFKVGTSVKGVSKYGETIQGNIIEVGKIFHNRRNDTYLCEDEAKELNATFLSKPNFFMLDKELYKAVDIYCIVETEKNIQFRMMQDNVMKA